jgi:hypothetical protein
MKKQKENFKYIGAKIKDFHYMYKTFTEGEMIARSAIGTAYGEDLESVWEGLLYFDKHGFEAYKEASN